jgi:hypothetical protein
MLYFHPAFMLLVVLLALYVLWLGVARFRQQHLGHKTAFNWKRHVLLGRLAVWGLLLGMAGGLLVANWFWGTNGLTGLHFYNAFAILVLALAAYVTGRHMDVHKQRRTVLPLAHAANNVLLALLLLLQAGTGIHVLNEFVLY